ncbi:unnamed protein product [Ectocarpus sp. 12 AP-2014]
MDTYVRLYDEQRKGSDDNPTIGLMTLRPNQPNRTFDTLKYKFYCEGGRDCTGAGYEGYGMQIFPYPKSEKPR